MSRRWLAGAAALVFVLGCGSESVFPSDPDTSVVLPEDAGGTDAGCDQPCGATCCDPEETCAGGACCQPESETALCEENARSCGPLTTQDACGRTRTVDCGSCLEGRICLDGACCEDDARFCQRLQVECGLAQGADDCGKPRVVEECGPCLGDDACTEGQCICVPETDQQLCDAAGLECGSPTLTDRCGSSRHIAEGCGTCDESRVCRDFVCVVPPPPENDECTSALPLEMVDGVAHLEATTRGATHGSNGSCAPTNGRDVVYYLTLTAPSSLRAELVPLGAYHSFLEPAVYILDGCGPDATEHACARERGDVPPAASALSLPEGTYYIVVDGEGSNGGDFALTVSVGPPLTNEDCALAKPLAFEEGRALARGDTTGALNDFLACSQGLPDGGDLFYSLELPASASIVATLRSLPTAITYLPVIAVLSKCPPAAGLDVAACAADKGEGSVTAIVPDAAAGTWYVVVDGTFESHGPFELQVEVGPPVPEDTCAGAREVVLAPETQRGTAQGDTTVALDDFFSSCHTLELGRDVVFYFRVPEGPPQAAEIRVQPKDGSGLEPILSVRKTCADPASELACLRRFDATEARVRMARLAPGAYYVLIDADTAAAAGPFTLEVQLSPSPEPPTNDVCERAEPLQLDLDTGMARISGTTQDATDDYAGKESWHAFPHTGGDVAYAITLSSETMLTARVRSDLSNPFYRPAVYLRTRCDDAGTEAGGGNETAPGSGLAFVTTRLTPGTWFVVVDGALGTTGGFELVLSSTTNDTCASPRNLTFDGAGQAFASNDLCAATYSTSSLICDSPIGPPDLVYTFHLDSPADVTAVLTPHVSGTSWSTLFLRSACDAPESELVCSEGLIASQTTHVLRARHRQGPHALWVSTGYGDCWSFDLAVTATLARPFPENDVCEGAEAIAIDPLLSEGVVRGDTFDGRNHLDGRCQQNSGPDLVYSLALEKAQAVTLSVTPETGSSFRPVLVVRRQCAVPSSEASCDRAESAGQPVSQSFPILLPGVWYIVVDSVDSSQFGAFALKVALSEPTTPDNDECSGATPLYWDEETLTARIEGDTTFGSDGELSFCSTANAELGGRDLFYSFSLTSPATVTARVVRAPGNTSYRPAVSIRRTCDAASELVCARDVTAPWPDQTVSSTVSVALPEGDYLVVVDGVLGWDSASGYGPFALELTQAPFIPADGCANPQPLHFDPTTGIARVEGDTSTATASGDGSCIWYTAGDFVYSLTLESEQLVSISLSPQEGTTTFNPVLYLRRSCADPRTEQGCVNNPTANLGPMRLDKGAYYVWVDSYDNNSMGPFTLVVTATEPPGPPAPNDRCAGALDLSLNATTHSVRVTGNTLDGFHDLVGTCSDDWNPHTGADLVYRLDVPQPVTLGAVLTRHAGSTGWLPALYLRSRCELDDPAQEPACVAAFDSGASTVSLVRQLPGGSAYYLVVDGVKATAGAFTLDVYAHAQGAAPASCAFAQNLEFDANGLAVAVGDTSQGEKNLAEVCGQNTQGAPELVYAFTTQEKRSLSVVLTPVGSFQPAMAVQSACGDASTTRGCQAASSASPIHLSVPELPAGPHYIWVDGTGWQGGSFLMRVQLAAPPEGPVAYDDCRDAARIAIPSTGSVTVSGSTLLARDDYQGACAKESAPHDGPDVVYTFTLDQAARVTAKLLPSVDSPSFTPALYIRSQCGMVSDDSCTRGTTVGAPTALTASLPAGTWFLVVDGVSRTAGAFDLVLSQSPAEYVAGEACSSAVALEPLFQHGSGGRSVTFDGNTAQANNDDSGTCQSNTGGELVYFFTLQQVSLVEVTVAPADASSGYTAGFYLRRTCAPFDAQGKSSEVYCVQTYQNHSVRGATFPKLAPGTYYLFIESNSPMPQQNGPFTATVSVMDLADPPANDQCSGAVEVTLPASGEAARSYSGTTATARGDDAGACKSPAAPLSGADVAYWLRVPSDTYVTATVTPVAAAGNFQPALVLRRDCAQQENLRCELASGAGQPAILTASLAAGDYYLIVDGVSGTSGGFVLSVSQDSSLYAPGDNCANPIRLDAQLVPGEGGVATFAGDSMKAAPDSEGGCGGQDGRDLVYAFTLTDESLVEVTVGPEGSSSSFVTGFYLRSSCSDGLTEIYCDSTWSQSTPLSARLARLMPGTYYLWVDTSSYDSWGNGTFTGTVKVSRMPGAPLNDRCETAAPLDLSSGTASATGELWDAVDDSSGECAVEGGAAPDVVYSVVTQNTHTMVITLTRDSTTPRYSPVLYVRTACGQSVESQEVACARDLRDEGMVTVTLNDAPPGTYYVWVDGTAAQANALPGRFLLQVDLHGSGGGPGNDACPGAKPLTFHDGVATETENTSLGSDDTINQCSLAFGRDVVYRLDLAEPKKVVARIAGSGYEPALEVRHGCWDMAWGNVVACATSPWVNAAELTLPALRPGRYYVWADAGSSWMGEGAFTLTVRLEEPEEAPANDTCEAARVLALGEAVEGDTRAATNDYLLPPYAPVCVRMAGSHAPKGPDVVYSYTPASTGFFVVKVEPSAQFDAMVWVTEGVCGAGSACVALLNEAPFNGGVDRVAVYGKEGQTYYIGVDGTSFDVTNTSRAGRFSVVIE